MSISIAGLYAIADTATLEDARLIPAVRAAIEGGARIIQYRDKSSDMARRERQARALASLCHELGIAFLVNDDVTLARAAGADGVHIGRADTTLAQARAALGRDAVIGISCYNEIERALHAQVQGADYVAFGSFFASRTKPEAVRASVELLQKARAELRVPIVAIGGITPENGGALIAVGANALAVIEGVFGQADVRAAAARYAELFN
jgi:thiamine-phosphate pyrophosphorylase